MWRHPITAKQIRILTEDWGVKDSVPASAGDGTALTDTNPVADGWFQVIKVGLLSFSLQE